MVALSTLIVPTVWFAPPEALVPPSQKIKIEPISITVSGVFALVLFTVAILLWNRKDMLVFMDDYIRESEEEDGHLTTVGAVNMREAEAHVSENYELSARSSKDQDPPTDIHTPLSTMDHNVRQPVPAHRNPIYYDEASDFFDYESDRTPKVRPENLPTRNGHQRRETRLLSNTSTGSQYEESHVPSAFVMMSKSQTGDNY